MAQKNSRLQAKSINVDIQSATRCPITNCLSTESRTDNELMWDSAIYLRLLRDELPKLLENLPLQLRLNMRFQHDGAPPHRARRVQQYLNYVYPDKWIGINVPIEWPPKSPDLTPLDFCIWGTLKNEVYKTPTSNLEHLKDKIRSACENISRYMLIKASMRERKVHLTAPQIKPRKRFCDNFFHSLDIVPRQLWDTLYNNYDVCGYRYKSGKGHKDK
ncbi:hypothetical protein NQ318_000625 [Aromia moschata]|uniref:Uncharacterized protein n=1 Tax=Aromia moschata TaxID=1265417 RepID=A0AAV8XF07_9CUCU|nr:hypothetical protein NQ318_000625 [Aromia moschata]